MRASHTANTRLDLERTRGWSVGRRIPEAEAEGRKFFEHGDIDDCCRRKKQGQAEWRMRDRKEFLVMVVYDMRAWWRALEYLLPCLDTMLVLFILLPP